MSSDYQVKQIGFWISQKRSGMSQAELAKKAGISQQQLSKIEAGGNCTVATLLKILDALGEKIELPLNDPGSCKYSRTPSLCTPSLDNFNLRH